MNTNSDSVITYITDEDVMQAFLEKRASIPYNKRLVKMYKDILETQEYKDTAAAIVSNTHVFSTPQKKLISKYKVGKKRTVYTLNEEEMMAMRLLAYSLYRYDHLFSPNLYSFRRNVTVKDAVRRLYRDKHIRQCYGYKTDIHNYFNSINMDELIDDLEQNIDDPELIAMLRALYRDDMAIHNGRTVHEEKGAMAGLPIAAFLANYYLRNLDRMFHERDVTYCRYADDIIIFAESEEELEAIKMEMMSIISAKGLTVNPKKELMIKPGEPFEFLGFSLNGNQLDISKTTVRKMKGKIRRTGRSFRRWMLKKDAPLEGTLRSMIKEYNNKFYGYEENEISWNRWYFPTVTTAESFREIDQYLQMWLRYVGTGNHCKKNHEVVPYEMLKRCGYRPLVHEYYASKDREDKED